MDRDNNERNEREKAEANRTQQNGHRGTTGAPVVDAELLERVKQRREEEERRANERRLAAAKKLQELEQKINKKKELSGENESSESNAAPSLTAPSAAYERKGVEANEPRTNDRYRAGDDGGKSSRDGKEPLPPREYGNRYESKFDRDSMGDRGQRDRGVAPIPSGDAFFNKPYQSNLPPRFQKQRDQQDHRGGPDRHSSYKSGESAVSSHRSGPPREQQIRRPNQAPPHVMKRNVVDVDIREKPAYSKSSNVSQGGAYSSHSKSSSGQCESEDDDRVSSGRESISRSSLVSGGERTTTTTQLARSTSDSSQPEFKDKIGSWADEMEFDTNIKHQTQRQISSTSSTSASQDDNQPKQILQRVRKVSIESHRSDKEKSEERELSTHSAGNTSIKSLTQSQEDVSKQLTITSSSMIEAPKSWADSVPTTPEIARKSIEVLSDSSSVTTNKTTESDKKPLESVLENEPSGGGSGDAHSEKKLDDKSGMSGMAKIGRSYGTTAHSKDTYSSDDGKHGNVLKSRPNTRGGRHDCGPRGSGPTRGYGGNSNYRGNSNWNNNNNNNRRGRSNRYNDYSESDGSDDEYHHGGGGRGGGNRDRKDGDRFKHDSSGRQQSHQKDVFVPRGEPSRRGRGGG